MQNGRRRRLFEFHHRWGSVTRQNRWVCVQEAWISEKRSWRSSWTSARSSDN